MRYAALREANALQRVLFAIEFSREFSETEFSAFGHPSYPWVRELPRRSVSNAVSLQIPTNRIVPEENKVVGLSYELFKNDGSIKSGLKFDNKHILFIVGEYTSWNEIWPNACRYLKPALGLALNNNSIVSFAVEYTDLFFATGDYSRFDARKLLKLGSEYVPPHVFDRTQNFHFYTGFFKTLLDPAEHRVLTRINADLKDGAKRDERELSIVLYHQILARHDPWGGKLELDGKVVERGLDNFSTLHDIDKATLKEILNPNMAQEIGL